MIGYCFENLSKSHLWAKLKSEPVRFIRNVTFLLERNCIPLRTLNNRIRFFIVENRTLCDRNETRDFFLYFNIKLPIFRQKIIVFGVEIISRKS